MVQPAPDNSTTSCNAKAISDDHLLHRRATDAAAPASADTLRIPEIEETAEISTRTIETGTVRISKHVHDVERTFHPDLHDQRITIERVPVNRIVKTAPDVRTEGNTTVIPIIEEVMVKLLLIKEEVRVTREIVAKPSEPQHVTLRREEVIVDRHPTSETKRAAGPS